MHLHSFSSTRTSMQMGSSFHDMQGFESTFQNMTGTSSSSPPHPSSQDLSQASTSQASETLTTPSESQAPSTHASSPCSVSEARPIRICPVVYNPVTKKGDLMDLHERHARTCLFLYNENFEDRLSDFPGGGSACMRPFNKGEEATSVGIFTGWSSHQGGFPSLTDKVRLVIDLSFERAKLLLRARPEVKRVVYSCDPVRKERMGQKIFTIGDDVHDYISSKIRDLQDARKGEDATLLSLLADVEEKASCLAPPPKKRSVAFQDTGFHMSNFLHFSRHHRDPTTIHPFSPAKPSPPPPPPEESYEGAAEAEEGEEGEEVSCESEEYVNVSLSSSPI